MKNSYLKTFVNIVIFLIPMSMFAASATLNLTKKEKNFIESHQIRCISTGTWEPFNVLVDGHLEGIGVDYWNFIKKKLGLKSTCKIAKNFDEVLSSIKNKKADLNFATGKTKDREKYALFSKPYSSFPIVIATRNDVGFISNMNFLKDKIITVGENYTATKLLKKYYPNLHLVETKDIKSALQMVSDGKAYAAIDILPVIAYSINKYSFANLKIAGKTPWRFDVRVMVRKDLEELIPMINRAIDAMPKKQKKMIYKKWVQVRYQEGVSVKVVLMSLSVILIILLLILGWVMHLKKEIKKREILEKKLEILATFDNLTSVYNRYKLDLSLEEQIEIVKRYKRDLSIIFCDIDFFKKINDIYGHKIGDKVLRELANFISERLRKSDIFGRWGGEEFLILLPETSKEEAVILAEKLRKNIEKYRFNKIGKLTCSFGVVTLKENDNLDTIILRVDKKLYEAKLNGRNRVEVE